MMRPPCLISPKMTGCHHTPKPRGLAAGAAAAADAAAAAAVFALVTRERRLPLAATTAELSVQHCAHSPRRRQCHHSGHAFLRGGELASGAMEVMEGTATVLAVAVLYGLSERLSHRRALRLKPKPKTKSRPKPKPLPKPKAPLYSLSEAERRGVLTPSHTASSQRQSGAPRGLMEVTLQPMEVTLQPGMSSIVIVDLKSRCTDGLLLLSTTASFVPRVSTTASFVPRVSTTASCVPRAAQAAC